MSFLAWAASLALATSYVAILRVGQPQSFALLDRNDPRVIKFRFARVSLLCLATVTVLPWLLSAALAYPDYTSALRQLGVVPGLTNTGSIGSDWASVAGGIAKMAVLYIGPIANYVVTGQYVDIQQDAADAFTSIWGFRDHVFAPITEELVYRAGTVAILQPYTSNRNILMYSPLLFGLAHLHHGYQLYTLHQLPLALVAVNVAVQFAYTTIFGVLAGHFYLNSGNMMCSAAVHGMCNLFGFPSFDMRHTHPRWFYVYCLLLVAGAVAFLYVV